MHTYAEMDVSAATFNEVKAKLEEAGYYQALHDEGRVLDMHGIALKAGVTPSQFWDGSGGKSARVDLSKLPGETLGSGYPDWPDNCLTFDSRRFYQLGVAHARAVDRAAAVHTEPDGRAEGGRRMELTVWFGSLPESNGKANWTAILHRGDIQEGFTIARSEYKDRVRYDADVVRFMLGELDKEPSIRDYDGDLIEHANDEAYARWEKAMAAAHADEAVQRGAYLEIAARFVLKTFKKDLEQGYVTRDKQFVVDILGRALDYDAKPSPVILPEKQRPIPPDVYWAPLADNFYDANGNGMGLYFYGKWKPRCHEFPQGESAGWGPGSAHNPFKDKERKSNAA